MLLSLVALSLAQTQGYFLDDTGQTFALTDTVANSFSGALFLDFDFTSDLIDSATGLYVEPKLWTALSVETPLVSQGQAPWVFGGAFAGKRPVITSFNATTGDGEATAIIPINLGTADMTWPHLFEGINDLTLYWGRAQGMAIDEYSIPPNPLGSMAVSVTCFAPAFEILIEQSRNLLANSPCLAYIASVESKPYDRVFSLSTNFPDLAEVPTSVVLPANEYFVEFSVTLLTAGEGRITATMQPIQAAPGVTKDSPLFKSHGGSVQGMPNGGSVDADPSTLGDCIVGIGMDGPENSNGGVKSYSTDCDFIIPPPSSECRTLDGDGEFVPLGFARNTYCDWDLTEFCVIGSRNKHINVPAWEYIEPQTKWCIPLIIPVPNDWPKFVPRFRTVCQYKQTGKTVTINLEDCQ